MLQRRFLKVFVHTKGRTNFPPLVQEQHELLRRVMEHEGPEALLQLLGEFRPLVPGHIREEVVPIRDEEEGRDEHAVVDPIPLAVWNERRPLCADVGVEDIDRSDGRGR